MGFLQLLKSLDELLYEVMSWLVFYPVTLWRSIRHPRKMMAYADSELGDRKDEQYTDTLSPPLFLFLTLLLSHAIELAVVGDSKIISDKHGLAGLITDDTSLMLLRIATFSLFPLIMAARMLRKAGKPLDRHTLKPLFYAQCYPTGPFALALGLAGTIVGLHWSWAQPVGWLLILGSLVWYTIFQAYWYARERGVPLARGVWDASVGLVECLIAFFIAATLFT